MKRRTLAALLLAGTTALGACAEPVDTESAATTDTTEAERSATTERAPTTERPTTTEAPATTVPPTTTTTAPPEDPEVTNARRSAESYLEYSGFSRTGLIGQLEYEQYPTDVATAAVDSLTVDWNAEAVESAQGYVDMTGFSRDGLVDQLIYEGFTPEQAAHGADSVM